MAQADSTLGTVVPRRDWLLRTGLHIPPPRLNLVTLSLTPAHLDEGMRVARKLTAMSAPVDFDKTTLFGLDVPIVDIRRKKAVEP